MERSTVTILVFVSLMAVAGCEMPFSDGDGGTTAPTVTPAPVPTDEPTPTAVPQLAPGLTSEGVTDPFALAAAHATVLDGSAYTVRRNLTVRYANGSLYTQQSTDARIAANRTRYYVVQNVSGAIVVVESSSTATYSDGERLLVARTLNGRRSYGMPRDLDREPAPAHELFSGSPPGDERIYNFFTAVETRVIGERTRNGTTRYRLVGADVTGGADFGNQFGDPRNVTARAIIDSQGIVHEYRLRYEGTLNGANITVFRRAQYTEVGSTTVERPPWYEAAIRNLAIATPGTAGTTLAPNGTTSTATTAPTVATTATDSTPTGTRATTTNVTDYPNGLTTEPATA